MSTRVHFDDQSVELLDGETVLDALLKKGFEVPFSCRAGVCQSCIMECHEGEPDPSAQKGLKQGQVALKYFMACQCRPVSELKVGLPGLAKLSVPTIVVAKETLNASVLKLVLRAEVECQPGQYMTLWRDNQIGRSYSVAEVSGSGDLSFHLKIIEGGQFSEWASTSLAIGQEIALQGPLGTCIYQTESSKPMLLAGIGTGLAPLYGILTKALDSGHTGPIDLVLGAREEGAFYLVETLKRLAAAHSNLSVHWVAQNPAPETEAFEGDIYRYLKRLHPDLKGFDVYLCGAESFVKKLKKQCFLAGASMADIFADAFVSSHPK